MFGQVPRDLGQLSVEGLSGDVALQAPHDVLLAEAFGGSPHDVGRRSA